MNKYGEAVEKMTELFQFLESRSLRIPRTQITGKIGEWIVMDELLRRGYSPAFMGGQHPVDIVLSDGQGVEVKSGTFYEDRNVWLFDGIRPEKFDYLVCVKLEHDYSAPEFFVFTSEESEQIPYKRDGEDNRQIRAYDDTSRAKKEKHRKINEKLRECRGQWQKLPSAK